MDTTHVKKSLNFEEFPKDQRKCINFIVDILYNNIYPLLKRISENIRHNAKNEFTEESCAQIRNVYTLCSDQIRKCYLNLLEIIKLEYKSGVCLQESRQCTFERLSCCFQKLLSIEQILDKSFLEVDSFDNSILVPTMYFVNWIDQTFEVLNKLSNVVYKNTLKDNSKLYIEWKHELVECVRGLHTSIDELLLSSMTLCRYCLLDDQHVVKARCQVVLRETKALLSDLIDGDLDTVQPTIVNLKLPIMPSNVNLLIDVLKDVLYVLETNTNTALLGLVVHCFSQSIIPTEMLRSHFNNSKGTCACHGAGEDVAEKCSFIREFDLHNERLLQIGLFAMSCSSDQKRILCLRSGLASLEALEPHLVPAVMLSPHSQHSSILINIWNQEVMQIRDSVFLIVDPAAFADKARQMMHQKLLEITKVGLYDNSKTCAVINIGCVVYEFFNVYERFEPNALTCQEQLVPLLKDLNKVQKECKVVSNLLSSEDEHVYDVKKTIPQNTNISVENLIKRLKLLYTLVKRINCLLNPKENDEEFYEEPIENKNITQTLNFINGNTYINSPKKQANNITRSIFARSNMRSSTGKFPLAVLTKHLKSRNLKELSFSIQFDEICNLSEIKIKNRETSILYSPFKPRSSLRKAVLNKLCAVPFDNENIDGKTEMEKSVISEKESFIDDNTSLQITDVLNQINDLTNSVPTTTRLPLNSTIIIEKPLRNCNETKNNVTKVVVNNESTFKRVWNISINNVSTRDESACTSNLTQPSDVNTLERINDLDLVESKLSDLRSGHIETTL